MKNVFGISLICMGFVGILFFNKYVGELIPYPFLWFLLSIGLLILGFYLLGSRMVEIRNKSKVSTDKVINALVKEGDKIHVNLDDCQIIRNNYKFEKENMPDWYFNSSFNTHLWDALYNPGRNVESVDVVAANLIYETNYNGVTRKFYSPKLPKDELSLRILLDMQKETYIYVDRQDPERYFFDLSFLLDREN